MAATTTANNRARTTGQGVPPAWIRPQLAALVKAAPDGDGWLHEIKFDGCTRGSTPAV